MRVCARVCVRVRVALSVAIFASEEMILLREMSSKVSWAAEMRKQPNCSSFIRHQ